MAKRLPGIMVTVQADGTTTTDFLHFPGTGCLAASRNLHALLAEYGISTEITTITPKPALLAASRPAEQVALTDLSLTEGASHP